MLGWRGQRADGVPLDRNGGPRRNVVQHHRQRRGVGDGGEVRDQSGLRRTRVVRRHHQQAVRALGLARPGELDAVRGVVGSRAGDDARAVPDRLQHRPQQRQLLAVRRRRRFTGGARKHQAVAAGVDEMGRQPGRGVGVQGAVGLERRSHRGQHGAQLGRHVESAGAHGQQDYSLGLTLLWLAGWLPPLCRQPARRSRSPRTPAGRRR